MNTIARVMIAGNLADAPQRKTVNNKALAEFQIADCGLRISAWAELAAQVPESGALLIEGKLATRTYPYQGQTRTTTEIRASSVTLLDGGSDDDALGF